MSHIPSLQPQLTSNNPPVQDTIVMLVHRTANQHPSLVHCLEESGYSVQHCDTLNDVFQQRTQAHHEPHLLIIHEQMLRTAGNEVLERLRETFAPPVRIIVLADEESKMEDTSDGPDALIA